MSHDLLMLLSFLVLFGTVLFLLKVARDSGAASVRKELDAIRGNVPLLNQMESGVMVLGNRYPQGLDVTRTIFLAAFNIGLQLTPTGDARDAINLGKEIFSMITDNQPNLPPISGDDIKMAPSAPSNVADVLKRMGQTNKTDPAA